MNLSAPEPLGADNIARTVTAEGLGSGFQFCHLSAEPLFDADGQIRRDVSFAQLAELVWFAETGIGFPPSPQPPPRAGEENLPSSPVGKHPEEHNGPGARGRSPLLGIDDGRARAHHLQADALCAGGVE